MVIVYSSMNTAGSYKASRNDSSYYGAGSVGFFRFLLKFLGSSEFLKALEATLISRIYLDEIVVEVRFGWRENWGFYSRTG